MRIAAITSVLLATSALTPGSDDDGERRGGKGKGKGKGKST
jgi:hypothetical protein